MKRQQYHKKMTMFRLACMAVAAIIVFFAGSTRNYTELHERLIIQGIGIDQIETGYRVSIHALKTTEENKVEMFQSEGDTVYEALNNVTLQTGKTPIYSHNIMVLLGRDCAERGLNEALDFFVRYHESRPIQNVFLAQNTAAELFNFQRENQYVVTQEIDEIATAGKLNSQFVETQVLDVVSALYNESDDAYLPILSIDQGEIKQSGTGIFQGDRLQQTLDLPQTRGLIAVTKKLQGGTEVVEDPSGISITAKYSKSACEIQCDVQDGQPVFHVKVKANANITEISGNVRTRLHENSYDVIADAVSEKLKTQVESAIRKAVLENHCDIFRFGNALRKQQTGYWKAHADTWQESMADAVYQVDVKTEINMEGQELSPSPFQVW